jgi:hypothetical protein
MRAELEEKRVADEARRQEEFDPREEKEAAEQWRIAEEERKNEDAKPVATT